MTDQKPDPSELTPPTHDGSPTPEPEGLDSALDQTEGTVTPEGGETMAGPLDDVATDVQAETDVETAAVADADAVGDAVPGSVAETEAEAADAALPEPLLPEPPGRRCPSLPIPKPPRPPSPPWPPSRR